jgi:hypothetical protein
MSLFGRRIEIECAVDLERSLDSFHAYAVPEGIEIGPGDQVLVHDMPTHLEFGEHRVFRTRATVLKAGLLRRLWTEWSSVFGLTGLYEVGFLPAEELSLRPREAA